MPFLILTFDKAGHAHIRDAHRAAHYGHLRAHQAQLIASGGMRDEADEHFIGGAIMLDTDSREAAEAFAASDPFTQAGLFERVEIVRWRPAFVNGQSVMAPINI